MAQRITIMMSDEIAKKVRSLQAKLITKHNTNYSFSRVVDMILKEGLKKNHA